MSTTRRPHGPATGPGAGTGAGSGAGAGASAGAGKGTGKGTGGGKSAGTGRAPRPASSATGGSASRARPAAPRASASRPTASRPAARRPASPTPGRGVPRAQSVQVKVPRLFTVRVMVLALVMMAAFVLVFPTLRSYLQQREELRQLNAQVVAARTATDEQQAELARWEDPAYVMAQARERLAFVLPGESAYRIVDPETVVDTAPAATAAAGEVELGAGSTLPWYQVIWGSVQVAGAEPSTDPTGTDPTGTDPAVTDPAGGASGAP